MLGQDDSRPVNAHFSPLTGKRTKGDPKGDSCRFRPAAFGVTLPKTSLG